MKNKWIIVGISVAALAVLAITGLVWGGTAYAQTQTPPVYPYGMMGGYGMMGAGNYGPMHDYMVEAFAEALNLTPEEVQSRIEAGETPWQIAQDQGLTQEQIQQLMLDAHDKSLDQAVEDGLLTQEQADWMDQHMESMWSGDGAGFGGCHGAYGDQDANSETPSGSMMRWNHQPSL
jgi:hypothetical protein